MHRHTCGHPHTYLYNVRLTFFFVHFILISSSTNHVVLSVRFNSANYEVFEGENKVLILLANRTFAVSFDIDVSLFENTATGLLMYSMWYGLVFKSYFCTCVQCVCIYNVMFLTVTHHGASCAWYNFLHIITSV